MPGTSRKTRVKRHLTLSTKRKRSTAKNLDKWRERKRNICLVSASECQSNATVFHDLPKTDESGITSKHNTVMSEMNNNDEIIESTDTSFVRLSECQISDSFHHSTPKDHDIISKKDNVTEDEPTGILNNDDLPDAGRETITIRRNDSLDSDSDDSDWLAGIELLAPRDEEDNEDIAKEISIHGRRIVNIDHFIKSLQSLENHQPFDCKFSDMYLINDRRIGLIDELTFHCKVCRRIEKITTDILPNNGNVMNVNTSMVEGMTNIGQGYSQLEELCCSLDMPCMSTKTYNKHQELLYTAIHECSWESMAEAAKEEAKLAIEEGRVDKETGTPEITVVVDVAWSKRSYKTNYNALSGVACIMGYKTKKVLFVGVRNSYCSICARAEYKQIQPAEHVCYKNWTKSSTAMEADIIVEGFKKSIEMYNLKYVNVIGDGDSSVTSKLTECQPYGPRTPIIKIECTNHLLRNYIRKVRDIGEQRRNQTGPVPGELRDKVLSSLMRLRHAVTGAVKHHKKNMETQRLHETVKLLQSDIINGPNHVFGDHSKCPNYFCKRQKEGDRNYVELLKSYGVWQEIMAANAYLTNFTYSLLQCVTSNIVESYNAIVCKLVGGKRVNFIQRNSYTARSELSALTVNNSEELHRVIHKKLAFGLSPGLHSKSLAARRWRRKSKPRKKLFREPFAKKSRIMCADKDYGDVPVPDLEPDVYESKKFHFMKSLELDAGNRDQIESDSRGQSSCELWKNERRKRLTASNFGKICRMRQSTSCQKTVVQLLYKEFTGNKATKYGMENERVAITALEDLLLIKVEDCGLYIDPQHPFLAASPDGVWDQKALVEVKCPASAKNLTPAEAVRQKVIKFCYLNDEGELRLKTHHCYHYQVQGQLHITGKKYCFFVVWTPHGLSVEKIMRDDEFWRKNMENPLTDFYFKCILPELNDPRYPRGLPIRDRI